MDPDFLEELMARVRAEADLDKARRKKAERARRRRAHGEPAGVDAGLEEIGWDGE